MTARPRPVVLCILDGWGDRPDAARQCDRAGPDAGLARPAARWPHAHLDASEHYVGLPDGQMGNSEVGHTNLGAGRVVLQDLPRIDKAIADGSSRLPALSEFIAKVKATGGTAHVLGLMSPGGVHSHQHQIAALAGILADGGWRSRCMPFSTAATRRPNRRSGFSGSSKPMSRAAEGRGSRRSPAAITRWTATSAGTGSRRPIGC